MSERYDAVFLFKIETTLTSPNLIDGLKRYYEKFNCSGLKSYSIVGGSDLAKLLGTDGIRVRKCVRGILETEGVNEDNGLLINFSWRFEAVTFPFAYVTDRVKECICVNDAPNVKPSPFVYNNIRGFMRRLYDGEKKEWWQNDKIKALYFETGNYIQDTMKEKAFVFELEYEMQDDDRNWIANLLLTESDKAEIRNMGECDGIIFTSPFAAKRMMKEEDQKALYMKMYEYYSQYGNTAIKVHPADTVNYEYTGCKCIVYGSYPSEIYKLFNIRFDYAIAVSSSAVQTVDADERLQLDLDYNFSKKTADSIKLIPLNK